MTWTIIQSNDHENGAASSTTVAVTLGAPVTPGNLVVVFVGYATAANDVTSITDDKGNNYTLQDFIEAGANDYGWHSAWFTPANNGPITITSTSSAAHTFSSILAIEIAPPAGATATFDTSAINTQLNPGAAADAVTSTAKTTASADIIIGGSVSVGSVGLATGTGFTTIQSNVGANSFSTEYLIQGAPGSQAATFTVTLGGEFSTAMLAFSATFGGTTQYRLSPKTLVTI